MDERALGSMKFLLSWIWESWKLWDLDRKL